jgi:hypothetical protein
LKLFLNVLYNSWNWKKTFNMIFIQIQEIHNWLCIQCYNIYLLSTRFAKMFIEIQCCHQFLNQTKCPFLARGGYRNLNSGPCTWQAGALPLEPHLQPPYEMFLKTHMAFCNLIYLTKPETIHLNVFQMFYFQISYVLKRKWTFICDTKSLQNIRKTVPNISF